MKRNGDSVFASLKGQLCIVTSNNYPFSIGGEETFIAQYCRFLTAQGIPFTVVSASSAPRQTGLDPVHIRPFSIPLANYEVYNLLWVCLATIKILRIHSSRRIGVIHSIDTGHAGLAGVLASRILDLRIVAHSHGRRSDAWRDILRSTRDWRAWGYWALQRSIDRFVAGRSAKVIAVSSEVVTFLTSLGVPGKKIFLIPSAIEIGRDRQKDRASLRKEFGIRGQEFTLGYVGRLARLKGLEVLIEAYARVIEKSSGRNLLLIAGDGPLRTELLSRVKAKSLQGVRFLGVRSDVTAFLEAIDLFVLPSFSEGSPISLLEAMAAGCVIVASDIPAVRAVAKDAVLTFPPGDSSLLAELIVRLKSDPTLRETLSESAIRECKKYSTATLLPQVLAVSIDP